MKERQVTHYEDANGNKKVLGKYGTATVQEFDEAIKNLPSLITQAREGNTAAGQSAKDLLWALANEVAQTGLSEKQIANHEYGTTYVFGKPEDTVQRKIDETIKTNSKRVWIGDPCYVLQYELWDDVCKQIFKGGHKEVGHIITVNYKGNELSFIQCGTAYGDGCYNSGSGFEYGVDAGCLAIVPEELIHEDYNLDDSLGNFFEIETGSISLETDGKGTFYFGDGAKVIETIWTGGDEN